jgi:hypothetical protein
MSACARVCWKTECGGSVQPGGLAVLENSMAVDVSWKGLVIHTLTVVQTSMMKDRTIGMIGWGKRQS